MVEITKPDMTATQYITRKLPYLISRFSLFLLFYHQIRNQPKHR